MMFPHCNIHKCVWVSPDGKNHSQIDHIPVDRQRHLSVDNVRSFRTADCDTDHYLVVAKVRERLVVNKQRSHSLHTEMFNLKKLNDVEGKEQFRVEVSPWLITGHIITDIPYTFLFLHTCYMTILS
jgi:hypothetical protein